MYIPSLSRTPDLSGSGTLPAVPALSAKSGLDDTFRRRTAFISFKNAAICAAGTVDFIFAEGFTEGAGTPGVAFKDARAFANTLLVPLSCKRVGMRPACCIGGGGGGGGGGGTAEE